MAPYEKNSTKRKGRKDYYQSFIKSKHIATNKKEFLEYIKDLNRDVFIILKSNPYVVAKAIKKL